MKSIYFWRWLSVVEGNVSDTVTVAYLVLLVGKVHLVFIHAALDALERIQQIGEDGDLPLFSFLLCESRGVDEAHLLQDSRLPTLAGTYYEA